MIKVGITGQAGFVGLHLFNTLGLLNEEFERVPFKKEFFSSKDQLNLFVSQCDVIVHLAAMNRHIEPKVIYETNIRLANKLVEALVDTKSNAHVIFSSSTQEERDNDYGKSKKEAREILSNWSRNYSGKFTGLVIPNVFGPFGLPNYNSVIATFCHKLTHVETPPNIDVDGELKLIYVGELIETILHEIRNPQSISLKTVPFTAIAKVSEILALLQKYKVEYLDNGSIPLLKSIFELNLFNTFRSYIDCKNHFPVLFKQNTDSRGSFVEIIRLGIGGQVSFSTTLPGVTRGNHFHTRKIERFAVISGKALIQLRRIGTDEILEFYLDGISPSFVDMPIWYTHNIKNVGEEVLYTNFWINEFYNPNDPDTYLETV
jgi:UDP-2-acetamido-2,6-beta-L-arabino-hexul-4-ose reductase